MTQYQLARVYLEVLLGRFVRTVGHDAAQVYETVGFHGCSDGSLGQAWSCSEEDERKRGNQMHGGSVIRGVQNVTLNPSCNERGAWAVRLL